MPIFFICFIVFVIWVRVKSNQAQKKTSTWDQAFWDREHEANFVRKKDITDLDYIQISEQELPFSDTATGEERERQEQVRDMLHRKMLNLSGMSNTDIKLAYGTANFSVLSGYDQNYTVFIRNLGLWGSYLHENCPEEDSRAKKILEFAVSLGSDITGTYLSLAEIYLSEGKLEKIQELIDHVEGSDFYMKASITKQLKACIRTYS